MPWAHSERPFLFGSPGLGSWRFHLGPKVVIAKLCPWAAGTSSRGCLQPGASSSSAAACCTCVAPASALGFAPWGVLPPYLLSLLGQARGVAVQLGLLLLVFSPA